MNIRHPKTRGEWAELRFMTRATELAFRVTKPWGDTAPYDLATDHRGRFRRVQVKCTQQKRWNSYRCCISANGVPYRPDQIDFIAAYVIPTASDRAYSDILQLGARAHAGVVWKEHVVDLKGFKGPQKLWEAIEESSQ